MLAIVRNRRGIVAAVEPFDRETGRLHLVHLECADNHTPAEERLLWEREPRRHLLEPNVLPDPAHYVHATPAVTEGIAFFGGCDETLHGVRISDGTEVTSVPAGAYTAASSAIRDGRAYFGTFDNEVAR